jgi:hypothetical protein
MFDPSVEDGLPNMLIFKCLISSTRNLKNHKRNGSRLLTVRIRDKHFITVSNQNDLLYPKSLQERINEEID